MLCVGCCHEPGRAIDRKPLGNDIWLPDSAGSDLKGTDQEGRACDMGRDTFHTAAYLRVMFLSVYSVSSCTLVPLPLWSIPSLYEWQTPFPIVLRGYVQRRNDVLNAQFDESVMAVTS